MTSWCPSCNAMIAVGDPMWPRFDQAGWICTRCANSQQPTPTERLLARLDYLARTSCTASLRHDELEIIHTLVSTLGAASAPRGGATPSQTAKKRRVNNAISNY